MGYIVTKPLVVAKGVSGDVYLYEGASVPEGLPATEVERLAAEGFIVEVEVEEVVEPVVKTVDEMTVDELKAYAEEHQIDLGEAKLKDDIRAKITAATAA